MPTPPRYNFLGLNLGRYVATIASLSYGSLSATASIKLSRLPIAPIGFSPGMLITSRSIKSCLLLLAGLSSYLVMCQQWLWLHILPQLAIIINRHLQYIRTH